MKMFIYLVLVLLLQQCGNTKSENGNVWTYSFFANTSIGNDLLTQASSQWTLSGILYITSFEKHKIMKLQNLMTSSYNGPRDKLAEVQEFEIPNHPNILTEAFVAHYNQNHKNLESVHFLMDEPIWSMNIKKAIASAYQLNYQFNPDSNDLEDIISETNQTSTEENIFGRCEVKYEMINDDNTLNIVKRIDVSKCKLANTTRKLWKNKNHGQFASETIRNYIYNNKENITDFDTAPFDKIISITTMQYSKMRTEKFGQTITQTIKLTREDSKQTDNNLDISSLNLIKSPVYEFENSETKYNLKGTPLMDNWDIQKVLVRNRTEYYSEKTFNMFEDLYATVSSMDWETLDFYFNRFHSNPQMLNIYASLLPFIGSDSSVKIINKLIRNEVFYDNQEISMLAIFPFYMKNINEQLLIDMENYLLPNNSLNNQMYHTYILSFSNLVSRFDSSIDKLDPQQKLVDIVNRYVDNYCTEFQAISDPNTRRHYLLGLGNMGSTAIDCLISIVKNKTETRHIRSLATYTVKPLIVDRKDMAFRIFWPIVKSSCEHYELRIAALTLLLESYLDSAEFYSIFMYMKKITDDPIELHLYSYFYTRLNCDKFWKQINNLADIFLADLKPPLTTKGLMTGRYYAQYSDADENFRTGFDTHIVANPISNLPNVVRVTFSDYINQNERLNAFTLYVKAEGISRFIKPKINFNMPIKELYNILKKYELEAATEEFYLEVIFYYNDKSVFSWGSTKYDLEVLNILEYLVTYFIHTDTMKFEYLDQTEFVSDLGTTVISELKNENVYSARFYKYMTSFTPSKGNETGHYISGYFKYIAVEKTDLKSLNPITNITHGVSSIYSLQRFLKFKVEHNLMDDFMLRWNDKNNILEHVVDFKDAVYINADKNTIIEKYCPNCSLFYFLTAPMSEQVVDLLLFKMKTVNCTASEAPSSDVYYKSRIVNSGSALLTPLISLLYARDYFHNVAPYDTCSGMFYLATNKKEPKEYSLYVKSLIYVENESNNVSLNWNISMNLYQHKLSNKQLVNEWYIQFVKEENFDKDTIKIIVDDKQKLLHIVLDSWFVTHHQLPAYDMFSLSAPPPISSNTGIFLYKNGTLASKLGIKSLFEVSEANKEVIKSSEKYMKCKAEVIDTMKHSAPTRNCFDVSNEISKYDDYSVDVEFSQTGNILQEIASERMIQLLTTNINESSTSTTNFHIKYCALNGLLELFSEKVQIKKILVPKLYRHKIQPKNKMIHNIMHNTYGLNSVCIITPYNVKTFLDLNVPYESMFAKSMVSLILCSNNTRIGLVTTVEDYQIGFRFWYDDEIFELNTSKNLTVNGNKVTHDQENNLFSLKFYEDSFVIITKKVELYYNQDYVSVNIKSMLIPDMCGTCSSDEVVASNIPESIYLPEY